MPALQGLVNAVVGAAEAGRTISCRKGCGACCRQLVPISRTEGEALLAWSRRCPRSGARRCGRRFAAAEAALAHAGLRRAARGRSDRELSIAYFALGVPCPFLEDESCSIHADRPLVCREYLVTSPAELCAGPTQDGVTPVPVPKLSLAARRLQDDERRVVPAGDADGLEPHAARQRQAPARHGMGPAVPEDLAPAVKHRRQRCDAQRLARIR